MTPDSKPHDEEVTKPISLRPDGAPDATWTAADYPLTVSTWNLSIIPPAFYIEVALAESAAPPSAFVGAELSAACPEVPFSLSRDSRETPLVSGQLTFCESEGKAIAVLSGLSYPGGSAGGMELSSFTLPPQSADSGSGILKPVGNDPKPAPPDTKVAPYWFVGQLSMTFPNGKAYIGTATLIAAKQGAQTGLYLLTCAHNLYDASDGGRAVKISFHRALNGAANPPYAEIEADDWFYPGDFEGVALSRTVPPQTVGTALLRQSVARDFGLVRLKTQVNLADAPTLLAGTDKNLQGAEVQLIGLYGWDDQDEAMNVGTGSLDVIEPARLGYQISTMQGASGTAVQLSPIESPAQIVGIHVLAGDDGDNHNYAVRLTKANIAEIEAWQH